MKAFTPALKQGVEEGKVKSNEWKKECERMHGRILTGANAHYCWDWDCMPIDETCTEFESCTCYKG